MATKLNINIEQGVLDVEGEEAFVKEIYKDFRDRVADKFGQNLGQPASRDSGANDKQGQGSNSSTNRTPRRRRSAGKPDTSSGSVSSYSPKIVKDINLSGVKDFFAQFLPKSHPEKILIFAKFLQEKGIETFTADQIYTCYHLAKVRPPKVFLQAFRDAHGKKAGFIEYNSPTSMTLTHIGETCFEHDLKRREDSK